MTRLHLFGFNRLKKKLPQEIPYVLEHRLMDWKELRDGSLRIEHHFIVQKQSQRQILVGKNGAMIGYIIILTINNDMFFFLF